MMSVLEDIKNSIITYKPAKTKEFCQQAIDEGIDPQVILSEGLIAGMAVIGEKFKLNKIYVPEVLISARCTHAGLDILKPILAAAKAVALGKIVLGTVKDDLHDIGKNLVAMMFEGAGFEVINLGVNVDPGKFVEAIKEHQPNIIAMSSLITSTLPNVEGTIKAIIDAGLRDQVKIMVGGAPVTEEWVLQIGGDGFGKDATAAVDAAKKLIGVA
ncbi:5-methyltetrahydrofolate--homocysteine methyltransferase [Desulfosporosinus sp. I2]|uniref:cobalamin B12-binding domain-containing protein n=1 Tax=Desulfosporosinus sp. I2 TaxID=1617025 RepID=UPI00061F8134|nr:corrinoid protein [Desulfosporosinus sp. I2]KJR48463.1 5-methyltetrahydrofolate--homocysteine methyltransferase [Desulfosporosinus sp. I2]